jgi:hypothetical protein
MRPKRVDVTLSSPEDGKLFSVRNVVFSSYLEFLTLDKVYKPNASQCWFLTVSLRDECL